MRNMELFYYDILPLLNLIFFIAFIVCFVLLVIKLIRHKKGIKELLIIAGSIYIIANALSWGLLLFVSKDRVYRDYEKYTAARGDKYTADFIPDDAKEITYWIKNPGITFGPINYGVSYKVDSDCLSDHLESILTDEYGENYKEIIGTENSCYGMTFEQWLSEYYSKGWPKKLNKDLIGNDDLSDYRVLYCNISNGIDIYSFVNEKTCRIVFLEVNHE